MLFDYDTELTIGKNSGKTIEELYDNDKDYTSFVRYRSTEMKDIPLLIFQAYIS